MAVPDIERKRRMARTLLGANRRGFAETLGLRVSNSPANLFQLLCLSILLRDLSDYRVAAQAAGALRGAWDSAARMARSSQDERVRVLRENGAGRKAQALAAMFGDLARAVAQRYGGDLRRLRTQAGQDRAKERRLLIALPGVDDRAVDLFFREVQSPWREVAPFADQRALGAARKLGLARSAEELADVIHGVRSEKIAWLVGALVRTDLENTYDQIREPARA